MGELITFPCKVCGHVVWVEDDWDSCTQVCTDCGAEHGVVLEVKEVWLEKYEKRQQDNTQQNNQKCEG